MKQENLYDIGIISLNKTTRVCNFGAALHSYALHQYLNSIGIKSVIIDYKRYNIHAYYINEIKNSLKIKYYKYTLESFIQYIKYLIKQKKFNNFFDKYCTMSPKKYNKKNFEDINIAKQYICDSDITWHPFSYGFDRAFMCDGKFMKKCNNIAYSVDFGSKPYTLEQENEIRIYSKNFKYISIRNTSKLNYIKKILARDDVITTIDPVFLLPKEHYYKICSKNKIKENYVLVYNCEENNENLIKEAKKFALEKNLKLKIINANKTKFLTTIGIEEFLSFIKNSTYFFTNGYHGICLAIILEKQFFVFPRKGNNNKIDTILEMFNIKNRYWKDYTGNSNINYNEVNNILKEQKKLSIDFITTSIEQI